MYGDGLTFVRVGVDQCGAWGCTVAKNEIQIREDAFYPSWVDGYQDISTRFIVHELGHAFDLSVCSLNPECKGYGTTGSAAHDFEGKLETCVPITSDGSSCLGRYDYGSVDIGNPYVGFAGGKDYWQFAVTEKDRPWEVFADMFVGWTYGGWANSISGDNRNSYMTGAMPAYIANFGH